jgi:RHS repeat-associated protein
MNQLREYQRGILSEDTGSGGHVISTAPALSIVERPALSIVEGPALSIVEGITLPGTDSVYSWTLDSVGNWRKTERTPVGGAAASEIRTHNKLHQVVKAGDVELAYDKSGNMTDDGSRTFEYDAFNHIRTVKRKADSLTIGEYTYDALGRRIRKTVSNGGLSGGITNGTTDYLYAGNQCIEERNASNAPTRHFVWGLYIDELIQLREDVSTSPADYYPLQDLLYRTTALTDSAGDIVEAYDTDAYGRTLIFSSPGPDGHWFTDDDVTTSQPRCEYIYTGRQYDPESQLYYYRARSYSPTLGRFMQRDPIGYPEATTSWISQKFPAPTANTPPGETVSSSDTGIYNYVEANPTCGADPLGLSRISFEACWNHFVHKQPLASQKKLFDAFEECIKEHKLPNDKDSIKRFALCILKHLACELRDVAADVICCSADPSTQTTDPCAGWDKSFAHCEDCCDRLVCKRVVTDPKASWKALSSKPRSMCYCSCRSGEPPYLP